MWPAPAAGTTGWTINSPGPASPTLTITLWAHRSEWEEAAGAGRSTPAALRVVESVCSARLYRVARFASGSPNSQAPWLVAGDSRFPGRPGNACSLPSRMVRVTFPAGQVQEPASRSIRKSSRPVPVLHCPHPGTTPRLQSSSPDSSGGRPHSGAARPSGSRRRRQTTR